MRTASIAAVALATSACSYDWSVAAGADASHDATTSADAAARDATVDADTHDVSSMDASMDASHDCASLLAAIPGARAAAKTCRSVANECTTTVVDECDCTQYVAEANAAYGDYKTAVMSYRSAGCPKPASCPTSCPSAQPGLCVLFDGGPGLACSQ